MLGHSASFRIRPNPLLIDRASSHTTFYVTCFSNQKPSCSENVDLCFIQFLYTRVVIKMK